MPRPAMSAGLRGSTIPSLDSLLPRLLQSNRPGAACASEGNRYAGSRPTQAVADTVRSPRWTEWYRPDIQARVRAPSRRVLTEIVQQARLLTASVKQALRAVLPPRSR